MRIDTQNSKGSNLDLIARVNRAIDYIVQNLDQPLGLEVVADVACFSEFHFHRVFKSLLGETLNQFVKRVRLERALYLLSHGPRKSLTQISLACGFNSSSDFSRSFKQRYGVPPREFDIAGVRAKGREEMQELVGNSETHYHVDRRKAGNDDEGFDVQLRRLPARSVAYIRVLEPYRPGVVKAATERLMEWAEDCGQIDGQWLGYMWEDPEIVALKDCRYDVGVEVEHAIPTGDIGLYEFPAMTVAQIEIRGSIELELRALQWLFGTWLPSSKYVPADQPCFGAWIGRPFKHGDEYFELFAQLPVERC